MKIRTIIAATCAIAFSMAGAISAHDGETVTKNFEAAIPNIPGKSLVVGEAEALGLDCPILRPLAPIGS